MCEARTRGGRGKGSRGCDRQAHLGGVIVAEVEPRHPQTSLAPERPISYWHPLPADGAVAANGPIRTLSALASSFAVMRIVSVHGCWPSLVYRMGVCLQGYAKTLGSSPDNSPDFVLGHGGGRTYNPGLTPWATILSPLRGLPRHLLPSKIPYRIKGVKALALGKNRKTTV